MTETNYTKAANALEGETFILLVKQNENCLNAMAGSGKDFKEMLASLFATDPTFARLVEEVLASKPKTFQAIQIDALEKLFAERGVKFVDATPRVVRNEKNG